MIKYGIISDIKKGFAKVSFEEDGIVTDWMPVLVRKSLNDKESWYLEANEHVVCLMDENGNEGVILGAIYNDEDTPDNDEGPGKFRKKFSDGTVIEYDRGGHKLTVDVKGSIEAKTTGSAKLDIGTSIEAKAGTTVKIEAGSSLEAKATTSAKVEAGTTLDAKAGVKATVEAVNIELKGIVLVTGAMTVTGAVVVQGALTAAGLTTSGATGINSTGNIITSGDVTAGGKSLKTHVHPGVQSGGSSTGPPA